MIRHDHISEGAPASLMRITPRISRPRDRRQICACKFDDWLVGRLHAFVRPRVRGRLLQCYARLDQ